jgi:ribosomal protein L3
MQFESRRAGVIAVKAGMMQDWDEFGARVPLTVLWIDECTVRATALQRLQLWCYHLALCCHDPLSVLLLRLQTQGTSL